MEYSIISSGGLYRDKYKPVRIIKCEYSFNNRRTIPSGIITFTDEDLIHYTMECTDGDAASYINCDMDKTRVMFYGQGLPVIYQK